MTSQTIGILHPAEMGATVGAAARAAGLPDGFFRAAGEIYESLVSYKDAPGTPSVAEVAKALAGRPRA